ncbi:MAG: glycosyl hydrolase family 30, partial [Muricauda sp. TMED12]
MKLGKHYLWIVMVLLMISCGKEKSPLEIEVFETAANGNKVQPITLVKFNEASSEIMILPEEKYQTITGFGGSFTEASSYLLNQMGP